MTTVPHLPRRTARRTPTLAGSRRRRRLTVLAFLSPGLIGLAVFFVYPLAANVYYSLCHFDLINPPRLIGLANYRYMVDKDDQIGTAVVNTLWYTVVSVPIQLLFALGVALLISRVKRGAGVYRTLFYLPTLLPPVAATLAFAFVLSPGSGPMNAFLGWLHLPQPLWFNDPSWSKPSLVLLSIWGVGNTMIVMLAGILDVPTSLYEAARIDGAGAWRQFRSITLPSISPVLLFAVVTGAIQSLQLFSQPYVASTVVDNGSGLTASSLGYPQGSTLTYTIWLYQQGFRYFNMGYASALSVVLFLGTLAVTLVILRSTRSLVHAETEG